MATKWNIMLLSGLQATKICNLALEQNVSKKQKRKPGYLSKEHNLNTTEHTKNCSSKDHS